MKYRLRIFEGNGREWKWVRFWNSMEKFSIYAVITGLVLVVAMQVVLRTDILKSQLQVSDSWYGQEYQPVLPASTDDTRLWGNIILRLEDYTTLPDAVVVINGKQVTDFTKQQVTVKVASGDFLEVDTTAYRLPIRVKIVNASTNINRSLLLEELTLTQERSAFGKVIFK